jgi:hypothetical protein
VLVTRCAAFAPHIGASPIAPGTHTGWRLSGAWLLCKGVAMSLVPSFSWFAILRWQRLRPAAAPDFGDMGTAFGLDASMDAAPPTTVPAFFMQNGRPETGAPERRRSTIDLREGQPIDRRSRL